MHVLSMRDLLLADVLCKYTEEELLPIPMDSVVNSVLNQVGFNIQKPVVYIPKLHRDMRHKLAIGYMVVGSYKTDRETIHKFVPSTLERALIYAESDITFTLELLSLLNKTVDYSLLDGDEDNRYADKEFISSLCEPDYLETVKMLKHLEEVRDNVRGSAYDESGNPKTAWQYMEYYKNKGKGCCE